MKKLLRYVFFLATFSYADPLLAQTATSGNEFLDNRVQGDSYWAPIGHPNCRTGYCPMDGFGSSSASGTSHVAAGASLSALYNLKTFAAYVQKGNAFPAYVELREPQNQNLVVGKLYRSNSSTQPAVVFYENLIPVTCPPGSTQSTGFFLENYNPSTITTNQRAVAHYFMTCTYPDPASKHKVSRLQRYGTVRHQDFSSQTSTLRRISLELIREAMQAAEAINERDLSTSKAWQWFSLYANALYGTGGGIIALSQGSAK